VFATTINRGFVAKKISRRFRYEFDLPQRARTAGIDEAVAFPKRVRD
jgi:hypothetical protein